MRWSELCALASALPAVTEDVWYRTPALKVRGKGFVRLKEDGESVVFWLDSVMQQEFLVATNSAVYFVTDHYRGYPVVLARIGKLRRGEALERLREAWLARAPKALRKELALPTQMSRARAALAPKIAAAQPHGEPAQFRAVYEVVRAIPPGRVATYGQIAELVGMARGHRVVARAMRSCPAALPWYRVLAKKDARRAKVSIEDDEHATLQRQLLREEGVVFDQGGFVVLAASGWLPSDVYARRRR